MKKFGLINLRIAPDAHRIASQIATFLILSFPSFGFPDAHCTPPIIMNMNETIKMAVTTIFESPPMRSEKAVEVVEPVPHDESLLIHFPTKGTFVLSFTHPSATQLQYDVSPGLAAIHSSYLIFLSACSCFVCACCVTFEGAD